MLQRLIEAHAPRLKSISKTINFGDIAAAALTGFLDFAAALPSDAIALCADVNTKVAFTDGAGSTMKVDVGIAGTTTGFLVGNANNAGSIQRVGAARGTLAGTFVGAVTPRVSFTDSTNLSLLTAGQVVVTVYYYNADKVRPESRF